MWYYRPIPKDAKGFSEPWKQEGCSLTNAKLNMRSPIDSKGNPANYIRLMFAVAKVNGSPKKVVAATVGLQERVGQRWSYDYTTRQSKRVKDVTYFSWSSYFALLSQTGIIAYDRPSNTWSIGPKWGIYLAEVIIPALASKEMSLDQLLERCNLK